jgi:hypothetical protein
MKLSPFDFLISINLTKQNLIVDEMSEKSYDAFMVNRGLSYFNDTIMYANQMNGFPHIEKKIQYEFYLSAIPKRKRFSKWSKKEKTSDTSRQVMQYYKYSEERALEAMSLLSNEQITIIEEKMYKGGRT